jgi:hypothetical protein
MYMSLPKYIAVITIVNVKTQESHVIWIEHQEQIVEYEECLEEDEDMFVNDLHGLDEHDWND